MNVTTPKPTAGSMWSPCQSQGLEPQPLQRMATFSCLGGTELSMMAKYQTSWIPWKSTMWMLTSNAHYSLFSCWSNIIYQLSKKLKYGGGEFFMVNVWRFLKSFYSKYSSNSFVSTLQVDQWFLKHGFFNLKFCK